jgi:hypothetical protein
VTAAEIVEDHLITDSGARVNLVSNRATPKRWRWVCAHCSLFGPWEDRLNCSVSGAYDHQCID